MLFEGAPVGPELLSPSPHLRLDGRNPDRRLAGGGDIAREARIVAVADEPPALNSTNVLLFLSLLYLFAGWLLIWYVKYVARDPIWLTDSPTSRIQQHLITIIIFVAAGLIPIVWFSIRRFEWRRAFGPLVLWAILLPVAVFSYNYVTFFW